MLPRSKKRLSPENTPQANASGTIRLVALVFLVLVVWANFASLDEVVRGPGSVVPSSNTQVIQSLEGGILQQLPVWEGKIVEAGETVALLSVEQFEGAFDELNSKVLAQKAKLERVKAEIAQQDVLSIPKEICDVSPDTCDAELILFLANRADFKSTLNSLKQQVTLQTQEVAMKQSLINKNILPELDYVEAKKKLNLVTADLAVHQSDYLKRLSEEGSLALAELNQYKASLSVRLDQLERTTLKAPVRAIVNKVAISTIGGVIPPAEPILELTPLDDELRVEAKISPRDVAYIAQNMPATVKLTAYDYTIFGSLHGEVLHISADTFEDPHQKNSEPYYKVFIKITEGAKNNPKGELTIRPGMIAQVEIHTGEKTVLQYLLKPLFKSREAFRER